MNSGKSTALLQAAFNYEERGLRILLAKPHLDTKGKSLIVSRLGVERETDFTISADEDVYGRFIREQQQSGTAIACLLIDEAQFLSETQVDDLLRIAVIENVPVLAYGIRTDFQTIAFPGSRRLLEVAHSIEELKTICRCGHKAVFNARTVGGAFVFDGDQVAIDGVDASYQSLCGVCYLEESGGVLNNGWRPVDEFRDSNFPDVDFA